MKARVLIALLATGTIASTAHGDTDFVGRWMRVAAPGYCSVVVGFELEAGGKASIDWAEVEDDGYWDHDGHWTASGNTLHLVIDDVESDPAVLKALHKTAPVTTEIYLEGSVVAGNRLEGIISSSRDRNIDGQPYQTRCVYSRR